MGMKLVIAEKPALARDIARAVCGKKAPDGARLPISGNGYTVVACAGHLLKLVEPERIDARWGRPWDASALPVFVPDWPKEPVGGKRGLLERIAGLLARADLVIHAGDPDDEGQLIVDEVLDYLGYEGEVLRVYVNDSIAKNIRRAFERPVPNGECRGAGSAAYARQMADMCFGVNETRLATCRLGRLFTVGRVQTPTLGLVVRRDEAIEGHVSRRYYELEASGQLAGAGQATAPMTFRFEPGAELLAGERRLYGRGPLDALAEALDGTSHAFTTEVTESVERPPLPYNLTVLLSDMSRRHGFTAAKTQQITQDLRDKYRAITYNRTDSQYLKEEHFEDAPAVLARAMENLGVSWPLDFSIRSRAFDDENVTAHHGIIPQEVDAPASRMTADEAKVYRAIVERYAMQFLRPAVHDVSTSTFDVEGGTFAAVCKRLREGGFTATFGKAGAEDDGEPGGSPWVEAGDHELSGIRCRVNEKETSPPKPYTEGTLITDMASIAKYVADPEVKAVLKQKDDGKKGEHGGIGTTATRAEIVEKLKERGYIEERAGKIRSTEKGREFSRLLPADIAGADVTARWWLVQQDVAAGKADVNDLQESVVEVFRGHMDSAYVGPSVKGAAAPVGRCPVCGKDVVRRGKIYSCSSNREEKQEDGTWRQTAGCGFKLFGFCGKKFTEKQASRLLAGEEVPLRGCKSKAGKTFDCKVRLGKDGELEPVFESRGKGKFNKAKARR